ncbi:FdhF/YdeP family oxidoreductase [Peristeroidobacter soli]|uniref:FdhF/YdeP family oxidoreductase n=1 Tax=Peristeroidobacter soli TaxID=2497877 RepID=UPI00101D30C2|nr:FdhF/YdeP family oxidoreductase [Peristeroidobacter soli]
MSDESMRPYHGAAGGWDALVSTRRALKEQGAPATGARALLKANQPDGFDCPGCAWPDPKHTSSFEFCENGAKAVAWETTSRTIAQDFFAAHSVSQLRAQSDHWLESQGRLGIPLRYDSRTDHYVPIEWADAYALIGEHLRSLTTPHAAAFYTSGRTSNEAAFLYQLFAREYGTNNMPDCSNLCHEATSVGLPKSIGVGKGTVQLSDFDQTQLILSFGHNPGTNHPRMLATLRDVARRGVPIVVFNPMRERGLERFRSPQHPAEMLTGTATNLATHYFQPRVGSDSSVLQGIMKRLLEMEREGVAGSVDRAFIGEHTVGFEALSEQLRTVDWQQILNDTGLSREDFDTIAQLYAGSNCTIAAYGMGITQHRHGTQNVQQLANLLLMKGNIGTAGAGICPVRGHSNVQGDRTMGIDERPAPRLLDRIKEVFGFEPPRADGCSVVECIEQILRGDVQVLISMGGNFAVAAPDTVRTYDAMSRLRLTVGVHTKLNRSHLLHRGEALILPALARADLDVQRSGIQCVTVEDSMSMVHASRGFKAPPTQQTRSEPAIVAGIAAASLPHSRIRWRDLADDYRAIRRLIEQVIPGFEDFEERVKKPGGFHLPNAAAQRRWLTPSGKAQFSPASVDSSRVSAEFPLMLATIRSHDQYNTTVYAMNDRYRGVHGRRDVVFMHEDDMRARGLTTGDAIRLRGVHAELSGFVVVAYAISRGSCAAYFPEANGLISLDDFDEQSHTPAYKSIPIQIIRARS